MEYDEIRVLAPAKLNLSLELLGKRADGYHELATHLLAFDRCDELVLRATRDTEPTVRTPRVTFRLDATDPDVPRDESNLAVRALGLVVEAALEQGAKPGLRYELELRKILPSGAGLGGGSADAAAAYFAATKLFGLDPDDTGLLAQLATLGSDIPFFVRARESGFGLATGRGECVEALPVPDGLWFAVVTPELHVKTVEVYANVTPPFRARAGFDLDAFEKATLGERRVYLRNDLEAPALRAAPLLEAWFELLRETPGDSWRLAGSGSSFFALFAGESEAQEALEVVRAKRAARDFVTIFECVARPAGHGVRLLTQ